MKVKDLMKVLGPLEDVLGDYDIVYKTPTGSMGNVDAVCLDSATQEVRLL